MYIKFPNFKTFANIAICPTDSGKDEFHVIDCGEGVFFDFANLSDGTVTCIPYRPGHMYVMYRGKDGEDVSAYVFKSEFEMKEYFKQYYGVPHISGTCIQNIPLFLVGDPAKVPDFVEFEKKKSEKSKKNIKNEKSKKNIKPENYKNSLKLRGGADEVVSLGYKTMTLSLGMTPKEKHLKLRGGADVPKYLSIEGQNANNLLTIMRSLDLMIQHEDHEKCPLTKATLCELCLMRSLVIRSKSVKARKTIDPVEFYMHPLEKIEKFDLKTSIKAS